MSQPDDSTHQLSNLAQDLAAALSASGAALALDEKSLQRWRERLTAVNETQRDDVVSELIALAVTLQRERGEAAAAAIEQLAELAGSLLPESAAASARADRTEIDAAPAHAAVTGVTASKRPVGSGSRPSGAVNPLALRLGGGVQKQRKR